MSTSSSNEPKPAISMYVTITSTPKRTFEYGAKSLKKPSHYQGFSQQTQHKIGACLDYIAIFVRSMSKARTEHFDPTMKTRISVNDSGDIIVLPAREPSFLEYLAEKFAYQEALTKVINMWQKDTYYLTIYGFDIDVRAAQTFIDIETQKNLSLVRSAKIDLLWMGIAELVSEQFGEEESLTEE